MSIVALNNVKKSYGKNFAVNGVNLKIEQGQIFGMLGPNGAGKSTTINMICGLIAPTEGEIYVLDEKITKNSRLVKNNIGVVPQDIAIYEDLTAMQNVKFFGSLYGIKGRDLKDKALEALEFVGLKERAHEIPARFSGGMKRRLNIACAIVHKPKLIIMDEPTVGIDPQSRNHILESIKSLNEMGCSIIYTSHYMEEIESICSDIAIIDNGEVIVQGKIEDIKQKYSDKNILEISVDKEISKSDIKGLSEIQGVEEVTEQKEKVLVYSEADTNNLDKIISYFMAREIGIKSIESKKSDLESIFLKLTGKKLRD